MKCKKCGNFIDDDSVFCEFCGTKVDVKKRKGRAFLWFFLALVLIAAGAFVFWNFSNEKKVQNEEAQRNMIINSIELYNSAYMSNDFSTLSTLFADDVERFYDVYNISNAEVIEMIKKYDTTFGVTSKHTSVRWNTLQVEKMPANSFSVVYVEDYSIDRKNKTKYSKFVIEKHLMLDYNYRIISIYDVQLSKSR